MQSSPQSKKEYIIKLKTKEAMLNQTTKGWTDITITDWKKSLINNLKKGDDYDRYSIDMTNSPSEVIEFKCKVEAYFHSEKLNEIGVWEEEIRADRIRNLSVEAVENAFKMLNIDDQEYWLE